MIYEMLLTPSTAVLIPKITCQRLMLLSLEYFSYEFLFKYKYLGWKAKHLSSRTVPGFPFQPFGSRMTSVVKVSLVLGPGEQLAGSWPHQGLFSAELGSVVTAAPIVQDVKLIRKGQDNTYIFYLYTDWQFTSGIQSFYHLVYNLFHLFLPFPANYCSFQR